MTEPPQGSQRPPAGEAGESGDPAGSGPEAPAVLVGPEPPAPAVLVGPEPPAPAVLVGPEPPAPAVFHPCLASAVDRAVAAGLITRGPGNDEWWGTVRCESCGSSLTFPAQPWAPEQTARRIDGFAARHATHPAHRATTGERPDRPAPRAGDDPPAAAPGTEA